MVLLTLNACPNLILRKQKRRLINVSLMRSVMQNATVKNSKIIGVVWRKCCWLIYKHLIRSEGA